jgi:hypothetical protein
MKLEILNLSLRQFKAELQDEPSVEQRGIILYLMQDYGYFSCSSVSGRVGKATKFE